LKKNSALKNNWRVIFFIILFIILQFYFILFPRSFDFFSTGLTYFNYFNSQSFLLDKQSFYDASHPGTPVYILGSLVLKIFGNAISDFQKYFLINKLLILLFNICSVTIFFNYFKKYLTKNEIFFILSLLISSFSFIFSFEIVDIIAYQLITTLLVLTYFFKSLEKQKKNFKLGFFLALALSIKITSIFLVFAVMFCKTLDTILLKKRNYELIKFIFLTLFLFLLFNFPIIGRLPVIAYTIFMRSDVTLDKQQIFSNTKIALTKLADENFILSLFLLLIISLNLVILLNIKKILSQKKYITIFVFYFLIFLSFLYTFIMSAQEYEKIKHVSYLEKELIFRSNYFYLIFSVPLFILINKFTDFKIKNIFFMFAGLVIFFFSIYNYTILRNEFIKDKLQKRSILTNELSKKINFQNSIIAYYNYTSAYGLNEGIFFMKGSSIYANDRFNNEIISLYPKYRFFRIDDVIENISHNKTEIFNRKTNQEIKEKVIAYDIFLKNNLPNSIYRILSYKSYFVYPGNLIERSDEIYSEQYNNNIPGPDLLMYTHNNLKNSATNHEEIKKYIEQKLPIQEYFEINCKEDVWHVFIIKKS